MTARGTADDKLIVELDYAREFAAAITIADGIELENLRAGEDPPDIVADCRGVRLTIELVELIDMKTFKKAQRLQANGQPGAAWMEQQWSFERYTNAVRRLVVAKDEMYRRSSNLFDILLIYTDEPWLAPSDMQRWNADLRPLRVTQFQAVYAMGSYVPGLGHYPLDLIAGRTVSELVEERRNSK